MENKNRKNTEQSRLRMFLTGDFNLTTLCQLFVQYYNTAIYANLFGQKISKRQQLTNWEADVLSDRQKAYAATDAWACINIYNEITRLLADDASYELIKTEEPQHETGTTEKR